MKTKHFKFITTGLAALMTLPAFAIEGPEDDAPPPPEVKQAPPAAISGGGARKKTVPQHQVEQEPKSLPQFKLPPDDHPEASFREITEPARSETAFLGVVSAEVPDFLAEHLELKNGEGVIVRSMAPDSPATKSGIAVNDVITAVAGQAIRSREELSSRVTAHKPGEQVTLDVVHKGKPVKIEVTLGVRPNAVAMAEPPSEEDMNLEGLPKEMADHIRKAIGGLDLNLSGDPNAIPPQMEDAIRRLHKRMLDNKGLPDDPTLPALPKPSDANIQSQSSATFRMRDNDGSIEVKSKDGAKEVTLLDQQDNVVWKGPWDTDKDRAAAPDNVRKRMESLHLDTNSTGPGLRFQFNGGNHSGPAEDEH